MTTTRLLLVPLLGLQAPACAVDRSCSCPLGTLDDNPEAAGCLSVVAEQVVRRWRWGEACVLGDAALYAEMYGDSGDSAAESEDRAARAAAEAFCAGSENAVSCAGEWMNGRKNCAYGDDAWERSSADCTTTTDWEP